MIRSRPRFGGPHRGSARNRTAILSDNPLLQPWGFKYDNRLGGIAVHADFAAVNINFWITPDDANLDPDSGGLIVWDAAAPLDWGFARYNDDVAAARDFLAWRTTIIDGAGGQRSPGTQVSGDWAATR